MITATEVAEHRVKAFMELARFSEEKGVLRIDKNGEMRRVWFEDELDRLLRNAIAQANSHRRNEEEKLAWFEANVRNGLPDHKFVAWTQEEIAACVAEVAVYKQARKELRASAA